jgi:NADH-quinone oxidoreductase subunit M
LAWLVVLPFVGAVLCWPAERLHAQAPRWIALATMAGVLVLVCSLGLGNPSPPARATRWMFEVNAPWIPRFGIGFHLALDGLSWLLVGLTAVIGLFAVACSWREVRRGIGAFHTNLLWSLGGVVGVFLSVDLFLFFCFWEMMLVPFFFLIAQWGHDMPGGRGRSYAATKYVIFTQASGLLMLLAILALAFIHAQTTGVLGFDYETLLGTPLSGSVEVWLMLGFFIAFAVKLSLVPLHSWLPEAHSQAPTAGSVLLAGLLLNTAGYGLLRFCIPLFPEASAAFAPVAMWLGAVSIIYGATLAFAQTDIKRVVAYSGVSHMGYVVIGVFAGTPQARAGVVMQMLSYGVCAAGLFIVCGAIFERLHTRELGKLGGLWPGSRLPPIALFFSAASLGLPGLGNFIGEFLILIGSFRVAPLVTVVATGGLILSAVYALWFVQRAFFGASQRSKPLADLDLRERATLYALMTLLLVLGLYPQPFVDVADAAFHAVGASPR